MLHDRQAATPWNAPGTPIDEWVRRQPLYDPAELRAYMVKRDAPVAVVVRKSGSKKRGAD